MTKLKVFVSSVQKEFASERKRLFNYLISDPLLGLFFEPFIFEKLPASDRKVDTAYINEVSKSDIYIGLFGIDYGYEDSKAKRNPKVSALIQKVGLDLIRQHFNTEEELITSVYASLVSYLKEKEIIRTGL